MPTPQQDVLTIARGGNEALAQAMAFILIGEQAADHAVYTWLGELALRRQHPIAAARWLHAALQLKPGDAAAASLLDAARNATPRQRESPGYLFIRSWGHGFWSDVDHVLTSCLLAELLGRTPVVDWGDNCLFTPLGSGINGWGQFFHPVSDADPAHLLSHDYSIWPPKWTRGNIRGPAINLLQGEHSRMSAMHFFDRDEDILVADFHTSIRLLLPWVDPPHRLYGASPLAAMRDLTRRYARPLPRITQRVDALWSGMKREGPILSVHIRGSDKSLEVSNLADVNERYPELIDHLLTMMPNGRVLLLTDSKPIAEAMRELYGERLILPEAIRVEGSTGTHFSGFTERARLGEEVLTEALLAARCDAFIGLGPSNVSAAVRHLKEWKDRTMFTAGEPIHDRIDLLLLTRPEDLDLLAGPTV